MSSDVDPAFPLEFQLNSDGTVSGHTPLNELDGTWLADSSSLTITLSDRLVYEVSDDQIQQLYIDYSMGTALVDTTKFLLSDGASVLSLFDNTGKMVLRAEAVR